MGQSVGAAGISRVRGGSAPGDIWAPALFSQGPAVVAAALHCVGVTPNRVRNHRENALGAANPSSSETSVSE